MYSNILKLIIIYKLGGIFHVDNYESEMAFKYAIRRINQNERNFQLVPLIKYVSTTDSFKTERIGEHQIT
jgi:hypothetical protein